ncbi:MAG: cob(I)yrinic acid a,c-diamide adenosyltransferase [Deltaproteobacteria bacterium]|jgi:cob(I)alamin adenosyltransferase|nr:cob(I)yrinic acid a,c-diamide adenosyltransferase [Deltaproteobacteria bacterium]
MRIYTKTGDAGETGLVGGSRVTKDHVRVEAYGDVDELNAVIGQARSIGNDPELDEFLAFSQSVLFELGAELATPSGGKQRSSGICQDDITRVEKVIDKLEEELPPLKSFILPGGTQFAASLHLARTVCRRAERHAVMVVHAGEEVADEPLVFLNRLSDALFVLARVACLRAGEPDVAWTARGRG